MTISLEERYLELDFNGKYVEHLISSKKDLTLYEDELKFRISQLNTFQMFKILDTNLARNYDGFKSGMLPYKRNLKLFMDFFEEENGYSSPDHLVLKSTFEKWPKGEFNRSTRKERRELELVINEQLPKLIRSIIGSLKFDLKIYSEESNLSQEISFSQEDIYFIEWIIIGLTEYLKHGWFTFFWETSSKISRFSIAITENQSRELFCLLDRYEFINVDKTSQKDFKRVLSEPFKDNTLRIDLNMDNVQFKFFFDRFKNRFGKNLKLINLENSNKIYLKGRRLISRTVSSSADRNKRLTGLPKRYQDINHIFSELKN